MRISGLSTSRAIDTCLSLTHLSVDGRSPTSGPQGHKRPPPPSTVTTTVGRSRPPTCVAVAEALRAPPKQTRPVRPESEKIPRASDPGAPAAGSQASQHPLDGTAAQEPQVPTTTVAARELNCLASGPNRLPLLLPGSSTDAGPNRRHPSRPFSRDRAPHLLRASTPEQASHAAVLLVVGSHRDGVEIHPGSTFEFLCFAVLTCRGRRLGNGEKCACKTTGESFVQTRFGLCSSRYCWLLVSMGFMLILLFSSMI